MIAAIVLDRVIEADYVITNQEGRLLLLVVIAVVLILALDLDRLPSSYH